MLDLILPKLRTWKHWVCVIRWRWEIWKSLEAKSVKVYYLDLKWFLDIGVIYRYMKVLNEFKPCVQVNYLIHADLFGRVLWKLFWVKKIVAYIRNKHIWRPFLLMLDNLTIFLTTRVLTNSNSVLRFYTKEMWVRPSHIDCIENWVDLTKFDLKVDRERKLEELWIDASKKTKILICIWRLVKQKDQLSLIKAFSSLPERYSDSKLIILWCWPKHSELISLIKKLNISDRVHLLWKRNDVLDILSISDMFILSSLHEWMSNALLEAMASKLPCVVSNIEENKELIEDKKNWLTFKVWDWTDLASKIKSLLDDDTKAHEYGLQARKTIEDKYDLEKIAKRFEEYLRKIFDL